MSAPVGEQPRSIAALTANTLDTLGVAYPNTLGAHVEHRMFVADHLPMIVRELCRVHGADKVRVLAQQYERRTSAVDL